MLDDIDAVIREAEAVSADAMHYSAAAAGTPTGETVPDPVAGLAPAAAARILAAAEQIDAEALSAALGDDGEAADECSQCSAQFRPSVLREFWCSEACERRWRECQVDRPRQVYFACADERVERSRRAASLVLKRRLR